MPKQQNGLPVTLHSPVCSKMFADEKRAVTCTKTRRVNAFTNMEVRHIFGIVKKYAILLNSCFLSLSRNESASSIYTFSKKLGKRIRTVVVSVLTGYYQCTNFLINIRISYPGISYYFRQQRSPFIMLTLLLLVVCSYHQPCVASSPSEVLAAFSR